METEGLRWQEPQGDFVIPRVHHSNPRTRRCSQPPLPVLNNCSQLLAGHTACSDVPVIRCGQTFQHSTNLPLRGHCLSKECLVRKWPLALFREGSSPSEVPGLNNRKQNNTRPLSSPQQKQSVHGGSLENPLLGQTHCHLRGSR